jgi:hypothetical protein
MNGEQRVFGAHIDSGEQPTGSLGPAVEHGLFTANRCLARQSTRDARCTTLIISIPIQAVRSFARLDGSVDVIEQPAELGQLLEGLGRFPLADSRLQRGTLVRPFDNGRSRG